MSDPPWPSFFGDTDTYDLGLPWDYNVGPSWPAAPAMGGIGMEEGTIADEGAGRLYEYLDCAAAALPHGTQLGDFQPPPADPATPTGMIMPAAERCEGRAPPPRYSQRRPQLVLRCSLCCDRKQHMLLSPWCLCPLLNE